MDSKIKKIAKNAIKLESKAVLKLSNSIDDSFETAVNILFKCKGRVVLTGIGKSGIIAMKIVATLNSTGTQSIFMHAADAFHGDLGIITQNDVVICVSKSGNSLEIRALIPFIKKQGSQLIGMTSNLKSYLANASDHILYTPVEKEACPNNLAPTTSTTIQLVMGDAIAMVLSHLNQFKPADFARFHPGGQLGKELNLTIGEMVAQHERPIVQPTTPIKDVIHEITNKRLGSTIVLRDDTIVGIITDGDIRRMLEKYDVINTLIAKDIMSPNPYQLDYKTLASEAISTMKDKEINHLVVCDSDQYIGIVHILDFIKEGFSV